MKKLFSLGMAILLMVVSATAFAQTATGNVYGKATDATGAVLPGASVTIAGEAGSRTTVTGSDGTFRFLNLDPSDYTVTVSLQGFGTANRKVSVQTGLSATLDIPLKVGGQSETVEVTAEAALVDVKKRGTSANLTTQDLDQVPTARDPWGVMNQVPGAMVDRVNIAGSENGQQAAIAGKGSYSTDVTWNLDGLVITDMSATGASPTYFDFGAFQEINVSTGGGDLTMQTGGFGLNMVTKRGTNQFHGGGRYFSTDEQWGSSNITPEFANDSRLKGGIGHCQAEGGANATRDKADHIDSIKDYGFDLGGPIIKDKLWFYGTWGKQDIKNCRFAGTLDDTLLPSYNAKLNWQASQNTMISAFYFVGQKQKFGRGAGLPGTNTDGVTWNQDNAYVDGGLPGGLWKLEVNHTFSPSFFMSAKAAYYDTGFGLISRGGPDKTYTIDYAAGESIGSISDYLAIRPQKTANIDGSYFFSGMGGNHELKFGFGYRDMTTNSVTHYNGNGLQGEYYGPGTGGGGNVAWAYRDKVVNYGGKYTSFYIGDVITKDRFTFNLGVRLDMQSAKNLESTAPANPAFPTRLPALTYGGSDTLMDFTDFSPRLGFSWALDEARKTVLRGSFARYGAQLSYGDVTYENPLALSYIVYDWNDLNGNRFPEANEVGSVPLGSGGIDPANPAASGSSPNKIDRDLKNRYDNEVVLGIDREMGSNFAIGAAFTYRKSSGFQATPRLSAPCPSATNCATIPASAYTALTPVFRDTGKGASGTVQPYAPPAALVSAGNSGRYRTNRDGYSGEFKGLEFTMNKRLSNKWGGRLALSFNDWSENFDGTPVGANGNPGKTDTDPLLNGGPVSIISGGSGKASFYSSFKWQVYANAIVQLPWSFDLSTSIFSRQGGTFPISISAGQGADNTGRLLVGNVDDQRYDTLTNFDFRLARNSKMGRVTITPSLELFNAFNNKLVLSRARALTNPTPTTPSTFNRVEEMMVPRILRIGVRLSF